MRAAWVLAVLGLAALALAGCSVLRIPVGESEMPPPWLAGSWVGEDARRRFDETWTEPDGGMMLGVGRSFESPGPVFFEYLRIESRGRDWFYVASPFGEGTTDFKLAREGSREVVFENLEHDDPVRILYRLEPDGSLLARTESRDGSCRDFRMRRAR